MGRLQQTVSALMVLISVILSPLGAQTQYRLKEVELTPLGQLNGLTVVLYGTFEIRMNQNGEVRSVEVVTFGDGPKEYRFTEDRLEKLGKGIEACQFADDEIDRIGNFVFRYASSGKNKIEAIGDTLFTYVASGKAAGRIERIGGLELRYSVAEGRLESIGSLKMEYRVGDKMLESFARIFAKEKEQTFGIRMVRRLGG